MKIFKCSLCGMENKYEGSLTREAGPLCKNCGSNARYRYVALLLAKMVWGKEMALSEVSKLDKAGIGTSEYLPLCEILSSKSNFKNTYYHLDPSDEFHLDITNIKNKDKSQFDFIVSCEVFEHIPRPVSRAFKGAYELLNADGVFVFTVPYTLEKSTQEHFSNLHNYKIINLDGEAESILVNREASGKLSVYDKLIFHGGPGHTLEHRVFCKEDIYKELSAAGFKNIVFWDEDFAAWGAGWDEKWSRPITAVKG